MSAFQLHVVSEVLLCIGASTGDRATTVLLLRAKLSAAEEQRTAVKETMQRLQHTLSSTQDNANLANSCLLKKVHAAQQAADTAQETLATSQQQLG